MILAFLLAAQAPVASAPKPQPFASIVVEPAATLIATCDANADAMVTQAELHACLARSFVDVARGKPDIGYIDFGDWAVKYLGDANTLPNPFSVDSDNDNRITLAELTAEFDRLFARFDADRNGSVTRAELLTIRSAPPPAPGARPPRKK